MQEQQIVDAVTLAKHLLEHDQYTDAADCLTRALEGLQKLTDEPTLGLPRGVDHDGMHYYAVQDGAIWEFDREGWKGLMERIAAGRGYVLSQYGRCLTWNVVRLKKMSQTEAKLEIADLGE